MLKSFQNCPCFCFFIHFPTDVAKIMNKTFNYKIFIVAHSADVHLNNNEIPIQLFINIPTYWKKFTTEANNQQNLNFVLNWCFLHFYGQETRPSKRVIYMFVLFLTDFGKSSKIPKNCLKILLKLKLSKFGSYRQNFSKTILICTFLYIFFLQILQKYDV